MAIERRRGAEPDAGTRRAGPPTAHIVPKRKPAARAGRRAMSRVPDGGPTPRPNNREFGDEHLEQSCQGGVCQSPQGGQVSQDRHPDPAGPPPAVTPQPDGIRRRGARGTRPPGAPVGSGLATKRSIPKK